MKILNKILIIQIILSCFFFSLTYADNNDKNTDCWTFGAWIYNNWFSIVNQNRETENHAFLSIDQQKAIITKNDLNNAILNLKKYCCNKELWWLKKNDKVCTENKALFNDNSLDSPYLFDHIFDVIMRKLNWLPWDTNIYNGMTLDKKWEERRSEITKYATSSEWATPQSITDLYKKYRTQSSPDKGYNIADKVDNVFWKESDQNFLLYVSWQWDSTESKFIATALQSYSLWTLYDRYINACALTEYFYALLNKAAVSNDKVRNIYESSKNSCNKIVKKQIQWESNYVSLIEQRASNKSQSNYIEWYISYMHERQEKLQNLIKDSKNRRLDIIRAVPGLQRQCQK
jgi:hypothetical protein